MLTPDSSPGLDPWVSHIRAISSHSFHKQSGQERVKGGDSCFQEKLPSLRPNLCTFPSKGVTSANTAERWAAEGSECRFSSSQAPAHSAHQAVAVTLQAAVCPPPTCDPDLEAAPNVP